MTSTIHSSNKSEPLKILLDVQQWFRSHECGKARLAIAVNGGSSSSTKTGDAILPSIDGHSGGKGPGLTDGVRRSTFRKHMPWDTVYDSP